jgi:hypothetical protein
MSLLQVAPAKTGWSMSETPQTMIVSGFMVRMERWSYAMPMEGPSFYRAKMPVLMSVKTTKRAESMCGTAIIK